MSQITNKFIATGVDAAKIADGSVSNTEFQYLDGVTSAIQTQIDGKQATGNYITALTGDVTASGPGSVAATIANLAVTNAKIANTTIDLTAKVTNTLPVANGGTGQSTYTDGQLLIGNTSGNTLTKAALTAGSGISITNGNGSISIATTGTAAIGFNITSQSTTYSAVINDYVICSGASFTVTLPTAVGKSGQQIVIQHNGTSLTQVYTLNTTSSQTIDGIASGSYALYTNKEKVVLTSDGSNWSVTDHFTTTPWSSAEAITITGTTTNPTKGNSPTTDKIRWTRKGANALILMEYKNSTATGSAAGSGDYKFGLPANLTADTTSISLYTTVLGTTVAQPTSILGTGTVSISTPNVSTCSITLFDSTNFRLIIIGGGGSGSPGSSNYPLNNSSVTYTAVFEVPISGWQP